MSWKYVIMRVGNAEVPVIFPDRMVHALVADALKGYFAAEAMIVMPPELRSRETRERLRSQIVPVSAGDCNLIVTEAFGKSDTLKLSARPHDESALNTHPYTGGIL